jgi:hypothetical protein
MTCIVGIVKEGVIYMGGDSAGVAGLDVEEREDEKVFVLQDKFLIGFTTSFRMGNLLRFSLNPPDQPEGQDNYRYMCTGFIEAVRKCFADNGFVGKSAEGHNRDEGGQFLVGFHGKLYTVHGDFQVGKARTNYNSVGCGRPYAMGALFATEGLAMSPQNRIILALRTAVKFSGGVRPPFTLSELRPGEQAVSSKRTG